MRVRAIARSLVTRSALAAVGLGAVIVAGTLFLDGTDRTSGPTAPTLLTVPVERRDLAESFTTRGVVRYATVPLLLGRLSGIVTRRSITPGDMIEAGAEILRINGRPVVAVNGRLPFWRELMLGVSPDVDVRQLERALAQGGFKPGRVDRRFTAETRRALKRWQRLHGLPVDGRLQIGDAAVATWPARIGSVLVEVGDEVASGGELLVLSRSEPEIVLAVSPVDRARLAVGQSVRIGLPEGTATGRLASLANAPTIDSTGAESYSATIALDEPGQVPLVEGSFLRVEIVIRTSGRAIAVPVGAVILRGDGRQAVRVADPGGNHRAIPITTGIVQGAWVEVTDGLTGDEVVVLGESQ